MSFMLVIQSLELTHPLNERSKHVKQLCRSYLNLNLKLYINRVYATFALNIYTFILSQTSWCGLVFASQNY